MSLETTFQRTKRVLRDYPEARDSDWRLLDTFRDIWGECTSPLSVTRCRQKLQNEMKIHPPTPKTKQNRMKRERQILDFARGKHV